MKVTKDDPCLCALRSFFAERFLLTRDSLGLTQMEFALDLGIDRRSYLDIEHRKNLCCAVTLLAYLCYFCDDPLDILNECRRILDKHLNFCTHLCVEPSLLALPPDPQGDFFAYPS